METEPLFQKILQSAPDDAGIEPFPVDAWLAASLLQKAIRRGDRDVAERAALTLHRWRGSATWRRLIVIAAEDIGIASPDVVAVTVEAACDPTLRRRLSDVRLLLGLVRELTAAPKDRSADLLAGYVHHHPRLEGARATMGSMSPSRRIAIASDPSAIIYQRAIAAWSASGIEWNRERRVGQGDLTALLSAFGDLGVPSAWLHVVQLAARRTREPLVVMLPLLWLDFSRARGCIIRCPLPRRERSPACRSPPWTSTRGSEGPLSISLPAKTPRFAGFSSDTSPSAMLYPRSSGAPSIPMRATSPGTEGARGKAH